MRHFAILRKILARSIKALSFAFPILISISQVDAFDSFEHIWAGDSVFLHFYDDAQSYGHHYPYSEQNDHIIGLSKGMGYTYPKLAPVYLKVPVMSAEGEILDTIATSTLSFGEIVAIAGDFVADPDGIQISSARPEDRVNEFKRVFRFLTPYKGNPFYNVNLQGGLIETFRNDFRAEYQDLILALSSKQDVKDYMLSLQTPYSKIKGTLSSGGFNKYPFYKTILGANLDHFGQDALNTYRAGHQFALELATQAHAERQKHRDAQATALLNAAYAAEAFADHYLTDLFSAGHIRTPRRDLLETLRAVLPANIEPGALANAMHDEDGFRGLNVASPKHPNGWKAFGDYTYFDNDSFNNRLILQETLQTSADEVWAYANDGQNHDHGPIDILTYLPYPLPFPLQNRLPNKDTENYFPLLRKVGNQWRVRKSWYRPNEFKYVGLSKITFATAFKKGNQFTFPRDDFYHYIKSDHGREDQKYKIWIDCYRNRDLLSENRMPQGSAKAYFIDNSATGTKFAPEVLVGFSPPKGDDASYDSWRKFFIVDEQTGCQFQAECHALWQKEHPETLEIRAHSKLWTYPLALYDREGFIHRVEGGTNHYKFPCNR